MRCVRGLGWPQRGTTSRDARTTEICLAALEAARPRSRCPWRGFLLRPARGTLSRASPAASGGLRAVFGLSRLAEASLQSLFLFTWPPPSVRFCIPVSFLSCHQSHQIRAHPSDLILVTYICNDCISKRGHSLRYWGLGLRHTDFGGNTTVLTPCVPPFLGVRSPT